MLSVYDEKQKIMDTFWPLNICIWRLNVLFLVATWRLHQKVNFGPLTLIILNADRKNSENENVLYAPILARAQASHCWGCLGLEGDVWYVLSILGARKLDDLGQDIAHIHF